MSGIACLAAAAAVAFAAGGVSAVQLRGHAGEDVRPSVVAHALISAEDEWVSQVRAFAECNATLRTDQEAREGIDCARSPEEAFEKSCDTIAASVVKASSGDRAAVAEYMVDVCEQPSLEGWRRTYCKSLAEHVGNAMTADAYDNGENFDSHRACTGFWSFIIGSEPTRAAAEAERHAMAASARQQAAEDGNETAPQPWLEDSTTTPPELPTPPWDKTSTTSQESTTT